MKFFQLSALAWLLTPAVFVGPGCGSYESQDTGGDSDSDADTEFDTEVTELGQWQAFIDAEGEFPQNEYRLFLWESGGAVVGQVQLYKSDISEYFDGHAKLYDVRVDGNRVRFRHAGEEEAVFDLELSGYTLVGTIHHATASGNESVSEAISFEKLFRPKMCDGLCIGRYCDMTSGKCESCGNQECEDDCEKDDDCPESYQVCMEARNTCYSECETQDDCWPGSDCYNGYCGFPNQFSGD